MEIFKTKDLKEKYGKFWISVIFFCVSKYWFSPEKISNFSKQKKGAKMFDNLGTILRQEMAQIKALCLKKKIIICYKLVLFI